ncbi:hypothetical protein [Macrococcus bovicus]|uniref:Uncharacterized protein n=1 Tax=Macrococcus bovicus TaxID=69968 RepID=A0A4R6BW85_9STAP|nr:hypothetical protein [Macrococcus bovicus]TDM12666.1 hypothetical protein ERX55_10440 [Macrococcus bovicus]
MKSNVEVTHEMKINILKKTIEEFMEGGKHFHKVEGSEGYKQGWNDGLAAILVSLEKLDKLNCEISVTLGGASDEPGTD